MPPMSPTEIEAFLRAPRHAMIGVNRPDGPPHLSPIQLIGVQFQPSLRPWRLQ